MKKQIDIRVVPKTIQLIRRTITDKRVLTACCNRLSFQVRRQRFCTGCGETVDELNPLH